MVARWMQAKRIKQARERKAWSKPYSIKSSAGPNWHNGWAARNAPLDVDEERRIANLRRVLDAHGNDVSRIPEITDIRKTIPDPFFTTTPCDTPHHRCRIFYNSRRTVYILQYVLWSENKVKLSIAYPTAMRAWNAFITDRAIWRKTLRF